MDSTRLEQLFQDLVDKTEVLDIAYHEIANGRLNPVLKTNTEVLGIERWKDVHGANPVYMKSTPILMEIVQNQHTVIIQDVKSDSRSVDEFFFFGIDSLLIIPVCQHSVVKGIVVVASIGKLHHFTKEQVRNAEEVVNTRLDIF